MFVRIAKYGARLDFRRIKRKNLSPNSRKALANAVKIGYYILCIPARRRAETPPDAQPKIRFPEESNGSIR